MDLDRRTILVLMDNTCVLIKVSQIFAAAGATVYSTDRSDKALRYLYTRSPDLIVMDHALSDPIRNKIREQERGRARTPILYLSVLRADCFLRGDPCVEGFAYVNMPFDPEVLLARARAALKRISLASRHPCGYRGAPAITSFAVPPDNTEPRLSSAPRGSSQPSLL